MNDPLGEDITSLMSYIQRNNRCLESLFISDYRISEEFFTSICSHLDLKQLSINCEHLVIEFFDTNSVQISAKSLKSDIIWTLI